MSSFKRACPVCLPRRARQHGLKIRVWLVNVFHLLRMVLDLVLFRSDQGGDPDKVRELQKKRFKDVAHVEKVIEADTRWRKCKTP